MMSTSLEPPPSEWQTSGTRLSPHRAPPMALPSDPAESLALVLRYVQTGDSAFDRSAAIEAMTARVARLTDPQADAATVVTELAGHAALLDALFQRWAGESIKATGTEAKATFARLALASQKTYTQTLIAIEGIKQQAKGRARLTVNADDEDE